jgi:hypothetical protein
MEERKGFLTPEQEKKLDKLIELKGIYEAIDGPAIKIADNVGLEKLKVKLTAENPDILPIIYQVIDEIIAALPDEVED